MYRLPSCDWLSRWVYTASPCVIGSHRECRLGTAAQNAERGVQTNDVQQQTAVVRANRIPRVPAGPQPEPTSTPQGSTAATVSLDGTPGMLGGPVNMPLVSHHPPVTPVTRTNGKRAYIRGLGRSTRRGVSSGVLSVDPCRYWRGRSRKMKYHQKKRSLLSDALCPCSCL
eukprot:9470714-Pyramimonas_sp.AAC.4